MVDVFRRAIWSSLVSSRKPGSCLAKSTISCTDMMASSVKWANRCWRTSRFCKSWLCGHGWRRQTQICALGEHWRAWGTSRHRGDTNRHFWPVEERPLVALLLHGHQLLDHLLLLRIQRGHFLRRGGGHLRGRAGRFLVLLLFHLLQPDLLLREHAYRSQEGCIWQVQQPFSPPSDCRGVVTHSAPACPPPDTCAADTAGTCGACTCPFHSGRCSCRSTARF